MEDKRLISICLPKGDAMKPLAQLLEAQNFPISEYHSKNRTYRPEVKMEEPIVRAKIMAEKDVAIQIAAGNYDIGFCGMDWIQEHIIRYRTTKLHLFKHLGLNTKNVYACTGMDSNLKTVDDLRQKKDFVVIISEYPNLAENFAIQNRLKKFKIFSAWGSVEAYPPEHADVVILAVDNEAKLAQMGLQPIADHQTDFKSDLCLILNRKSFVEKELSPVLQFF